MRSNRLTLRRSPAAVAAVALAALLGTAAPTAQAAPATDTAAAAVAAPDIPLANVKGHLTQLSTIAANNGGN
ncbi:Leupeptin-inactivating enzyme 1, partial [Streptomyces sp. SID8455]|nr:Leupeptin-inactivating enzyme 1 [Streptomyces sp. SID8455]